MTQFLLLNISLELTENYGGVAKEDGFFYSRKEVISLISFSDLFASVLSLER